MRVLTGIPDTSEYQKPIGDAFYPRRWWIFRICDGDYIDKNAESNLAQAKRRLAAGELDGFTGYGVYRPGKNGTILNTLDRLDVPHDCCVMIDAEAWGGQIKGDHSGEINQLATQLSHRQGMDERVWGYGNRGPDLAVWPNKPKWMGWIVASYGGDKPSVDHLMYGWQYTNGIWAVPGKTSSTAPFGRCDHNELYLPDSLFTGLSVADINDILSALKALSQKVDGIAQDVWLSKVGSGQPWTVLTQGLNDIKLAVGAQPSELAKAIYALLPKGTAGGLTEADVEKALKDFFGTAVNS